MKKFLCLLLILAMLLSCAAFANVDFPLHNGLKFGMTAEEVVETEKKAGVELTEFHPGAIYRWEGSIAGEMDSRLNLYVDENDGLYIVSYGFKSLDSYDTLDHGLIQKYGETPYSSKTGAYLKQPQVNHVDNMGYAVTTISNAEYSQWLIPYNDTQSILINHYAFRNEHVSYMNPDDSFTRVEHVIHYELLGEYMTEQYSNPFNGDL